MKKQFALTALCILAMATLAFAEDISDSLRDALQHRDRGLQSEKFSTIAEEHMNIRLSSLREKFEDGDIESAYLLGEIYLNGYGVKKDIWQAIEWYEKAADKGHVISLEKLGSLYASGEDINEDYMIALEYFEKAVDYDSQEASDAIDIVVDSLFEKASELYRNKTYTEALPLLKKADNYEIADAKAMLGEMYFNGYGVNKDERLAMSLLEKAKEKGSGIAQQRLAAIAEQRRLAEDQRLAEARRRDEEQRSRHDDLCDGSLGGTPAWHACRGNCAQIIEYRDAYHACMGEYHQLAGRNDAAWAAVQGDCSGLASVSSDPDQIWQACNSCGGGPRWTAMYLMGAVMHCGR